MTLATGPAEEHDGFGRGLARLATPVAAVAQIERRPSGLALVPADRRDPGATTSYGVGELILAALDAGAEHILLGCGDSGINDAGAGMAQALGVRLRDAAGKDIAFGGSALIGLQQIDLAGRDPRLQAVRIRAAVNWQNVLLGKQGVTRVYAAQKGASPEQIEELERGMENLVERIQEATGIDVAGGPGTGASGGLGAGLVAFADATLHPRFDLLLDYTDFDKHLASADLVLTAEGELDGRSALGKVPAEVGRRAAARGIPVIALAGAIGPGSSVVLRHGISAFASIIDDCYTREQAIRNSAALLEQATEAAVRMVAAGIGIGAARAADPPAKPQDQDGSATRQATSPARSNGQPAQASRKRRQRG